MNFSPNRTIKIDRNQAIAQLKALGYRPGEKCFFRAFFHRSDPRKANDMGRKCEGIYPAGIPWAKLESYQAEGRGIYVVVNGGGHDDASVTKGLALFYEHDDIGKDVQVDLWKSLGFLEPTLQVDTGGKSIHNYFAAPLTIDQWKELQPELLEHVDGDRKLKNPSRVMRLAGAWCIEPGKTPIQTRIISQLGIVYDYATLRAAIPQTEQPQVEQRRTVIRPSSEGQKTDIDWAIEWLNALAPWRADDHDEWVKVGMALHSVDDSLLNEWDAWSRQSEKYRPSECATRWKSFKSDANGVRVASLCEWAKQDGWKPAERKQAPNYNHSPVKTLKEVIEQPTSSGQPDDEYQQIRKLLAGIAAIPDPLEQEFKLARAAAQWGLKLDFLKAMQSTLQERKQTRKTCFTLQELMEMPDDGLDWVIPGLLPRAELVLLTAKPKTGKSLLAYEAMYAIATGGQFLNERVRQGKTLLIQTEEGKFSFKRRMDRRGFFDPALAISDTVRIETNFDINDLTALERILDDYRPDVVIFDSLRKISRNSAVSEDKAEFAKPVYRMAELIRQYNASAILIHHDNKNPEAQGTDAIAGTSALLGACWGSWRLLRTSTDESNPKRHLAVVPRDGSGTRLEIEYHEGEGGAWNWKFNQEIGVDPSLKQVEQNILNLLRVNPYPLSVGDLRQLMGLSNDDRSLYKPLNRMVERQLLTCKRDERDRRICRYSLPSSDCHPPSLSKEATNTTQIPETLTPYSENSSPQSYPVSNPGGESTVTNSPLRDPNTIRNPLPTIGLVPAHNSYIRNHPQEGGEGTKPFHEHGGATVYRQDAEPATRMRPKSIADQMKEEREKLTQVSEAEKAGLEVGDRVLVSVDHMDEYDQREIIKNQEAPVGQHGTIQGFKAWVFPSVGGTAPGRLPAAILLLDDGRTEEVSVDYLRGVQ